MIGRSVLAVAMMIVSTSATAQKLQYSIHETFSNGTVFNGVFNYDSTRKSLNGFSGTAIELANGGKTVKLTYDVNAHGVPPKLQSDGHGGVQDTLLTRLRGSVSLNLDIVAAAPTTLQPAQLTHNFYDDQDDASSGYTTSYTISVLGPLTGVPQASR